MKYLIVKPSSLGDILHAFPAVGKLLEEHPEAKVDWVIQPAFAELLDYFPGCDRRILFERKKLGKILTFPAAFFNLLASLRKEKYSAVFDLQGLLRSALIARLASAGAYYGPRFPKESPAFWFYSQKMDWLPRLKHALEKNSSMIAGFLGEEAFSTSYRMPVIERHKRSAERLFDGSAVDFNSPELIAVAPGARWDSKQWEPEFFADVLCGLAKKRPNIQIVLLGTKAEAALAKTIRTKLPEGLPVMDLCGKTTLGQLVEITRRARVFFCNDSGPMHIAAILNRPVAAMFGPTDPALTGPYCSQNRILSIKKDCIPCFKRYCETLFCHSVKIETAVAALTELMDAGQ